jgi:signal transduction histidine kinase
MLRSVSFALLVGMGYYLGTRFGLDWTPRGQPNSTFWPSNAILLGAFLLAPRLTWWWIFLLAVFPAHLIAQMQAGVPLWTALGWFITNTGEALIGAYCIKRLSPKNTLASVRGILTFVVFGVLIAPLATSFLDASAVVLTRWGRGYWPLSIERFWTNALAELTIVPTIVLCGSTHFSGIRKINTARFGEGALLTITTFLVAGLIFGTQPLSPATTPALLYVPLPLFLWAATRFGLGGLSLSLLSVALISIWYTMHGREPFPYASMPQNILSLQILFCVVAVPLMFLSAVMAEARRTQESLRRMSSSLLQAQEQERARIGRELHDDINQRLAMLGVELEQLQNDPSQFQRRARELRREAAEISNDVQALSHELHSSKLEYLGVVAGMKSFCKEFAERQKVEIGFKSDVSTVLPLEIGLSLFRVLQESLHNAVKHSGVQRIEVQLSEQSNEVHLVVSDVGKGFDVEIALQGQGLGLTSMRERVRLVNGTIAIESEPMGGTRIHVRVPLPSEQQDLQNAG